MSAIDVQAVLAATDPRLRSYMATRDRRLAKDRPWSPQPLAEIFAALMTRGVVRVGGRATCGAHTDPTWTEFRLWNEVVRKAGQLGLQIEQLDIKQPNGSPTRSGGFWNESEYRLAAVSEDA